MNSADCRSSQVEARDSGRSPKEHVEPESVVTSETVIQSRDRKNDWNDLREQSHWDSPRYRRRNIGPSDAVERKLGGSCLALLGSSSVRGSLPTDGHASCRLLVRVYEGGP
jgi:hypothetical protein